MNDYFKIEDDGHKQMFCHICDCLMIRRKSNYKNTHWWSCNNYPNCSITASEHPDGSIMSYPADKETKGKRRYCHELMDKIWKDNKQQMHSWLKANTSTGHIGKLNGWELNELILVLSNELNELENLEIEETDNLDLENIEDKIFDL